jgi:hypothetical protein
MQLSQSVATKDLQSRGIPGSLWRGATTQGDNSPFCCSKWLISCVPTTQSLLISQWRRDLAVYNNESKKRQHFFVRSFTQDGEEAICCVKKTAPRTSFLFVRKNCWLFGYKVSEFTVCVSEPWLWWEEWLFISRGSLLNLTTVIEWVRMNTVILFSQSSILALTNDRFSHNQTKRFGSEDT